MWHIELNLAKLSKTNQRDRINLLKLLLKKINHKPRNWFNRKARLGNKTTTIASLERIAVLGENVQKLLTFYIF